MKSGCRERRLRRPGAMASPPSPRSRPIRVTPASLEHQGRLRHPSLTLTPQKARHRPAPKGGNGYRRPAAASLFIGAGLRPAMDARRVAFSPGGGFTASPEFVAIPPEVCPSPRPVADGVHKKRSHFVSTRFYKASVHASPLPGAAIFRATNSGDAVKEKGSPARKKQIPRA